MKARDTLLAELLRMEHLMPHARTISIPDPIPEPDWNLMMGLSFDQMPLPEIKVRHFVRVEWARNWAGEIETYPGIWEKANPPSRWWGWKESG